MGASRINEILLAACEQVLPLEQATLSRFQIASNWIKSEIDMMWPVARKVTFDWALPWYIYLIFQQKFVRHFDQHVRMFRIGPRYHLWNVQEKTWRSGAILALRRHSSWWSQAHRDGLSFVFTTVSFWPGFGFVLGFRTLGTSSLFTKKWLCFHSFVLLLKLKRSSDLCVPALEQVRARFDVRDETSSAEPLAPSFTGAKGAKSQLSVEWADEKTRLMIWKLKAQRCWKPICAWTETVSRMRGDGEAVEYSCPCPALGARSVRCAERCPEMS